MTFELLPLSIPFDDTASSEAYCSYTGAGTVSHAVRSLVFLKYVWSLILGYLFQRYPISFFQSSLFLTNKLEFKFQTKIHLPFPRCQSMKNRGPGEPSVSWFTFISPLLKQHITQLTELPFLGCRFKGENTNQKLWLSENRVMDPCIKISGEGSIMKLKLIMKLTSLQLTKTRR